MPALHQISGGHLSYSLRGLFLVTTSLILSSTFSIIIYISSTSNLFSHPHLQKSQLGSPEILSPTPKTIHVSPQNLWRTPLYSHHPQFEFGESNSSIRAQVDGAENGNHLSNKVFHDREIFLEDYKEMNISFKIYIYPHEQDDPYANVFLPVEFEPGGNYASESYFKKVFWKSYFVTKDPSEADLFYLPFSIARLRHDPRIGVGGIQGFIRDYIMNISQNYPYWNRTDGADHFYVACHSIGRSAMEKEERVKFNAIQVVCSSSYFLSGYISHKDASLPQIWPRQGNPPNIDGAVRKKLAFFAGSGNSPVRGKLLSEWRNDSEIHVYSGHIETPYADELLGSKFCLHVKGFEVNTARIADSLYYGCVPVIIANHYDLPFADILNWKSFSVVIATLDIPLLKKILQGINSSEYEILRGNVLKVRKHFQWHLRPVDYDAFYMVMYELWLRRSLVRVPLLSSMYMH